MMNLLRALAVTMITLFNLDAMAATQGLVTVTNEEDTDIIKLYLVLDENSDVSSFKMNTFTKDMKEKNKYNFAVEKAHTGIVIYKKEKREIVKLISENFSTHQGGDVSLNFLYNGITGSRKNFDFDLKRDGDEWEIFVKGKKVKKLHFISNKKAFVGTIGVKGIQVIK